MTLPQKFAVSLNGTAYVMTLFWCAPANCWMMNLADQKGNAVLSGVPLVTGLPLLKQYRYLGVPGELFVQTDNDVYAVPTLSSLGQNSHLYFTPLAQ